MKRYVITALIALTLLCGASAQAQDASSYELTSSVIASSATIDGGDYSMNGALGQTDTETLSSGDYSLGGGFLGGGDTSGGGVGGATMNVYLPMVSR